MTLSSSSTSCQSPPREWEYYLTNPRVPRRHPHDRRVGKRLKHEAREKSRQPASGENMNS